jgi:hypothetical protein
MPVMRILFALSFTLLFLSASNSSITVKGRVVLNGSGPAGSVSVRVKGNVTGTITDYKGEFSLKIEKLPATLIFEYVGCKTVEYKVTEKNASEGIVVKLYPSNAAMEEVVVVGYATARKMSMTGSVSTIRAEEIRSIRREYKTLEGKAPGLSVEKSTTSDKTVTTPSTKSRTPGSNILTAGELSDFKKWKLWGDYSQSEFKKWSAHWGLLFKDRYCVQVQNEAHKALVGRKVHLINITTRDTVWTAVTDNTGKAELWSNLESDAKGQQSVYKIVCENGEAKFPVLFENGINRIVLKGTCGVSNDVDIAFVVDATGSMGDEIQYLKDELNDMINKTAEKYKEVNLHLASVFYRDHGDEYLTRQTDFDKDVKRLVGFIQNQSAGGGGDTPEAVEDALSVALDNLHWTEGSRARILFLVLDAPPHDAAKDKMHILIKEAAEKGIRIVPVVCSGIDKSAEYLMRCLALATNGSYVFLTDDSGVGNPHIKPTTDEFKVELLNNLLQRLIGEMIYAKDCDQKENGTDPANLLVKNTIKLNVYPNPTTGRVSIESSEKIEEIFLTDFTGKILMKMSVANKSKKYEADLGNYPSGTYLVKYFIKEKGWGAEKVVLLH